MRDFRRKNTHQNWLASLRILAWGLMLVFTGASHATEIDCKAMLDKVVAKKLAKPVIETAQIQLDDVGFSPKWIDGILGEYTQSSLKKFCESEKMFVTSDDLLVMLRTHAEIRAAYPNKIRTGYPDWMNTLNSVDFQGWAMQQPDSVEIGLAAQYGTSTQVIAILKRYFHDQVNIPEIKAVDDMLVSYSLDANDFKRLKSADTIFEQIEMLQDKTFANKAEFDAALKAALVGVEDTDPYTGPVYKRLTRQRAYVLDEDTLNNLAVAGVPKYLLDGIHSLSNLSFPDDEQSTGQKKIADELQMIGDSLVNQVLEFEPTIVQQARISPSGARFTQDSLDSFLSEVTQDKAPVSVLAVEAVREKLEKAISSGNVAYKNQKTLSAAIHNLLMQIVVEIDNATPRIADAAKGITGYKLGDEAMRQIRVDLDALTIPEVYLELLNEMQGADYPDQMLFWKAVMAKSSMIGSNNRYGKIIYKAIRNADAKAMDDALLGVITEGMKTQVKSDGLPLAPGILAELKSLSGKRYETSQELQAQVGGLFVTLGKKLEEQHKIPILSMARKRHEPGQNKVIQWVSEGCNCLHSNLAGTVYGLYPRWLTGEKQAVDFSVQTRLGYYALDFGNDGKLAFDSGGGSKYEANALDAAFVREARTYGTKVDMVVFRNDWTTWVRLSRKKKEDALATLAKEIAKSLTAPMTDFNSKALPYASLGTYPVPAMWDGVTLYFDAYPRTNEAVEIFDTFVTKLTNALDASGGRNKFALNLMFRSAELGSGIFAYENLYDLKQKIGGKNGREDSRFLVMLEEPTTLDKKALRIKIEDGLHGEQRMELLRHLIMVSSYDKHTPLQLDDDVIYARDSFGGIGFWPQIFKAESDVASAATSVALHNHYLDEEVGDALPVCRYVCPNKWKFRIAWALSLFVLMGVMIMQFISCTWKAAFKKHLMRFILGAVMPSFLLAIALLFCDPLMEKHARDNVPLIIVIALIIVYVIFNHYQQKGKADLP